MIDITTEKLISLREATQLLPKRRRGKKPSYCCVWRWATRGYHGTRLETIRVGQTTCTSARALQEFLDTITTAGGKPNCDSSSLRTSSQRERQIRMADEALRKEGILPK